MKRILLILAAAVFMASCSSPKYTYNFDHYNYNSGKKKTSSINEGASIEGPKAIHPEILTASLINTASAVEGATTEPKSATVKKTYAQMNKNERKELRTYLKAEVKNSIKAKKASIQSTSATKDLDGDLKLAAIFGAVGIAGLIIGGDVFYIIGGLALLIGVVFFVKWVIRQ
jgi:PBP1b-binding outer membrane lipoprotein LpoB